MGSNGLVLESCGSHNMQSNQGRFSMHPLNIHADPVFAVVIHFSAFKTEIESIPSALGIENRTGAKSF
jgi:hypothetical protein